MFKKSKTFPPVTPVASPDEYHILGTDKKNGDPEKIMSRSELRKFSPCPRKWLHDEPEKSTDAMNFGSVIDCLMLTPNDFFSKYAVSPDVYVTEDKKGNTIEKPWFYGADVCKQWREEAIKAGKETVSNADLIEARMACNRMLEDEKIRNILDASQRQVLIHVDWHDEETGIIVPFKCLIDLLPDPKSEYGDTIIDLKTTRNAEYRAWCRQCFNDGLHYQAAVYLDATNAATGLKYEMFGHILSENTKPYEPVYMPMSLDFLKLGRDSYKLDMAKYCRCLKSGNFEGYPSSFVEPEPWMVMLV